MRINKFLALVTGIGRRAADEAINGGHVLVNGQKAELGHIVVESDKIQLDGQLLPTTVLTENNSQTIMLHKPAGYVVSRNGQGSPTVYELLPAAYQGLKAVGRLDKDSSGLLILTNDGRLANELTHPSRQKSKVYIVRLNKPLDPAIRQLVSGSGVSLEDGASKLQITDARDGGFTWTITMHEGRNRQIRRTFAAVGYHVVQLHRTQFGEFNLGSMQPKAFVPITPSITTKRT